MWVGMASDKRLEKLKLNFLHFLHPGAKKYNTMGVIRAFSGGRRFEN